MRFIYAMLAVAIASTAFAQGRVTPQRTRIPIRVFTPAPVATEKPAFREETVTINPDVREPVMQRSNIPYSELPPEIAETLTQADQRKQAAQQKFYDKTAQPMLSPDGKELVGIVGNRYLTKDDLNKRVDLMMKTLPPPEKILGASAAVASADEEKQHEEDRRILIEGRVLDDWARAATMAVHAEHAATAVPELRVANAEVDEAIRKLSEDARINAGKIPVALQTVMFSERELRQEIRDGILVDKYMKEYVKRTISEQQMKELFVKTPVLFLEPTKVHAWALFIAKEGFATPNQSRMTKKELGKWRGGLKGCKKLDDFKELGAKIVKSESHVILNDMGWIQSTDALDQEIMKALFELKPGETSDVVESLNGYHIYKVLERQESEKTYYATVRPRIVDYLANSLKDGVYDSIKGQYGLRMAAGGLKKYTTTGPARDVVAERVAAALGMTTVTLIQTPVGVNNEPNLRLLRQRTSTGAGRRFTSPIPSVESVVGGRADTRASGPINPLATPKPFIAPAR